MNRGLSDVKQLLTSTTNVTADVARRDALRDVVKLVAPMAPNSTDADFILRRVQRMLDEVPTHD